MEREFRSRLPPPSSRTGFIESNDPAAAAGSSADVPVGESALLSSLSTEMSPLPSDLEEPRGSNEEAYFEEKEDEEDEDGGLDWGHGADSKARRRVLIGGGGGKGGGEMIAAGGIGAPSRGLESFQDDAEYESTLTALKVIDEDGLRVSKITESIPREKYPLSVRLSGCLGRIVLNSYRECSAR